MFHVCFVKMCNIKRECCFVVATPVTEYEVPMMHFLNIDFIFEQLLAFMFIITLGNKHVLEK